MKDSFLLIRYYHFSFLDVYKRQVQKNVIGINGLADLSFSPTAYHGVVASLISPGNFNGVGQVIYDTVAFPNILGEDVYKRQTPH